jgi:miniconductance mechanosensitive channel
MLAAIQGAGEVTRSAFAWSWPPPPIYGIPIVLVACAVAFLLVRRALLRLVRKAASRTRFEWDDALVASHTFWWLSLLLPGVVVLVSVDAIDLPADTKSGVERVVGAGMVFAGMKALLCALAAAHKTWSHLPAWRHRPTKGYVQVAQIFLWTVGLVLTFTTLVGSDPTDLLTGIGALTAVLLLVFKDTILSLVASIQLTSNDMIRVGDWISMPQADTDGDVIDVALHTVKVQNWDKTISTIPTHKLIAETFRNWRGMQESGGRRVKRAIRLDLDSVRFLDAAEIERLATEHEGIADWAKEQRERLAGGGESPQGRQSLPTNAGAFRAYAQSFLKHHARVHPGMTLLVRSLAPDVQGLPIELYFFTRTTAWADYEGIQAEIVDHLLAMLPSFGLIPFQRPAGSDVREADAIRAAASDEVG